MMMEETGVAATPMSFGQPVGTIMQVAYIVADIEQSMRDFQAKLKVGPWFVWGPFTPSEGRYRGAPTDISLTLALAFAGHMSIELIQQHDNKPSVYREIIERRGYGFHHWAVISETFDADIACWQAEGYEIAFSDRTPRGYRVAYLDTSDELTGMLEIVERTRATDERYDVAWRASLGWDGRDPVRRG